MGQSSFLFFLLGFLVLSSISGIQAESPYRYYTWRLSYAWIYPGNFGPQRGILINGQFPGPTIDCNTNDNIIVTIINLLGEPFLMTWNGVWQRKNSWQDGVLGTNCPIPSRGNYTYKMQVKDQIGTYMYFPSTLMQRASGGFGIINVRRRSVIPLPYAEPAGEFSFLIGDWYKTDHKVLQKRLDYGYGMPMPDGLLINGLQTDSTDRVYTGEAGKTYLFRVVNGGIMTSINIRIQSHTMKLVEVEGSHVLQEIYDSLDIHPGQSLSFLVTLNGEIKDYYIVASTRFTRPIHTSTAILHYDGSNIRPSGPVPDPPAYELHGSMKQARTIRRNLTANAARPNPQGSFRYGEINITKTIILGNSAEKINGKLHYGVNNISYVNPTTPLKLADYYNISGVFDLTTSRDKPTPGPMVQGTAVFGFALHDFAEIIFQNNEKTTQSWHLDGYNFFVVGYGGTSEWSPKMRKSYNMMDAVSRSTVQVYRNSWTAVLVSLDNKGMWNLRSAIWHRQYLGQQVYLRVWNDEPSLTTENEIPPNVRKCGEAVNY
ncbi:L-ascorbate oxidase homolog [Beta vulgaris subsp. vulgaris]|uniref:L-ascorbate oxidase homolog n=1 Tax=Beta vulgaris subsp. vulgaris TaxID=3555 RepID=UPI002036D70E|nr:L-ascorbate oxidase homolog [Beta vulgaris subsp. vulgaris]